MADQFVASPFEIVEGRTAPITFRIKNYAGDPVAINAYTPDAATNGIFIVIRDYAGRQITTTGKLTVVDDGTEALRGLVSFNPASDDFLSRDSGYTVRLGLRDGNGLISWVPSMKYPDTILVGLVT